MTSYEQKKTTKANRSVARRMQYIGQKMKEREKTKQNTGMQA